MKDREERAQTHGPLGWWSCLRSQIPTIGLISVLGFWLTGNSALEMVELGLFVVSAAVLSLSPAIAQWLFRRQTVMCEGRWYVRFLLLHATLFVLLLLAWSLAVWSGALDMVALEWAILLWIPAVVVPVRGYGLADTSPWTMKRVLASCVSAALVIGPLAVEGISRTRLGSELNYQVVRHDLDTDEFGGTPVDLSAVFAVLECDPKIPGGTGSSPEGVCSYVEKSDAEGGGHVFDIDWNSVLREDSEIQVQTVATYNGDGISPVVMPAALARDQWICMRRGTTDPGDCFTWRGKFVETAVHVFTLGLERTSQDYRSTLNCSKGQVCDSFVQSIGTGPLSTGTGRH